MNTIGTRVTSNPSVADLLATDSFGPDAVTRWEYSPDAGATWIEFRTTPLAEGQSEYVIHHLAPADTLYRTRFSKLVPTTAVDYSAYSAAAPVVAGSGLLSVAGLREHVTSSLSDGALQDLLNANSLAIAQRAGPLGSIALTLTPSRDRYVFLDRPVQTITSITEYFSDPIGIGGVVLDATDYRLLSGGTLLERWGYGTHPADWWSDRVELVYVPVDDTAERVRVLVKLCELDLNRQPGLSALSIGDYSEQSRNEAYNDEREAVLASLVPSALTFA